MLCLLAGNGNFERHGSSDQPLPSTPRARLQVAGDVAGAVEGTAALFVARLRPYSINCIAWTWAVPALTANQLLAVPMRTGTRRSVLVPSPSWP